MLRYRGILGAIALLAAGLSAAPAGAHAIVVAQEGDWQSLGFDCNPCQATLSFSVNAGSGPTNSVFVYSSGLVAIGAPFSGAAPSLTPGGDNSSPTNYFSVFYDTDPNFSIKPAAYYFTPTEDDIIFFVPTSDFSDEAPIELQLTPDSGQNPGAFTATWAYQNDSDQFVGTPGDLNQGYPLSGYQFTNASDLSGDIGDGSAVSFDYGAATSAAPEPATWIELIVGMVVAGAWLRRRSRLIPAF